MVQSEQVFDRLLASTIKAMVAQGYPANTITQRIAGVRVTFAGPSVWEGTLWVPDPLPDTTWERQLNHLVEALNLLAQQSTVTMELSLVYRWAEE